MSKTTSEYLPRQEAESPAAPGKPGAPEQQEDQFKCDSCDETFDSEDEAVSLYECGDCGNRFSQETSADGAGHRCPDCNKFGAKVSDMGCPSCNEGELQTEEPMREIPEVQPAVSPPAPDQERQTEPSPDRRGWFKAMRGPDALELIRANPLAFVLAYVIAHRARWRDGFSADGLQLGDALLGDWRACGMSQQEYRTAKAQLAKWRFATFRATSRGTIGKLIDTRLFSILASQSNEQNNEQLTSEQRAANEQLTTNQELKSVRAKEHKSLKTKKMSPCADAPRCEGFVFKAPRLKDAETFAESLCLPVDVAEEWWHKQAAQGWTVAEKYSGERQPMRRWQEALKAYCAVVAQDQ